MATATVAATEGRLRSPAGPAAKTAKAAAAALQTVLTDLIDLALQGKQAHWVVVGPNFRAVHAHLDEMVAQYREWSDEVAERIVALGVMPDGRVGTVAKQTELPAIGIGPLADADVVTAWVERMDVVIRRARRVIEQLDDLDLVSQDMVVGIVHGLEKQRWMVEAQRT